MTDTNYYLLASTFFESSKPFLIWFYFKDSSHHKSHIIADALRNLVLFAQFKKRENTDGGVFFHGGYFPRFLICTNSTN